MTINMDTGGLHFWIDCMEVADELDKIRAVSGRMLSQQIKYTAPHPTFSQEKFPGVQSTKHQFLCSVIEQIGDLNDCLWSFKSAISLRDGLVNDTFIQNPQLQIRDRLLAEASRDQDPPMHLEAVDGSHLDDSNEAVETATPDVFRANGSSAVHVQVQTSSPALENNPDHGNSIEDNTSQSEVGLEDANQPLRPARGRQANHREYEERVNDNLTYLRPLTPYNLKEEKVKMVIVGDGATGKTVANVVAMGHGFPDVYVPTVCEIWALKIGKVQLAILDTAGQEDYARLRPLSYPDTHVAVLAFSIANPDSLVNVKYQVTKLCRCPPNNGMLTRQQWLPEVAHFLPGVLFIVAGLQLDTRYTPGSSPTTTYAEGLSMAKSLNAAAYVECTALTNTGIRDLYNTVANIGVQYKHDKRIGQTSSRSRHCILM